MQKLFGAKSAETAIQIQSEYAKVGVTRDLSRKFDQGQ